MRLTSVSEVKDWAKAQSESRFKGKRCIMGFAEVAGDDYTVKLELDASQMNRMLAIALESA